jgi:hypothetical protein
MKLGSHNPLANKITLNICYGKAELGDRYNFRHEREHHLAQK